MRNLLTIAIVLLCSACSNAQTTQIGAAANPVTGLVVQPISVLVTSSPVAVPCLTQLQDGTLSAPLISLVSWTSSNAGVATIVSNPNGTGIATIVAVGTTTLTCSAGSLTGAGILTVLAIPSITSPNCATPPCNLPNGSNGFAYSFTPTAIGGTLPYVWSCPATCTMPGWMSINASTGALTGTAALGTTVFTIKVCDNTALCATLAVTVTVSSACGPPGYPCSRVDLTAVTLATVPPQVGPNTCSAGNLIACDNHLGAGTTVADPNFGTTICRLTDNTTTSRSGHTNFSNDLTTSGSGDENLWNYNHSMLVIQDGGGWYYPMNFSAPCTGSRMYATNASWSASGGFYFAAPVAVSWAHTAHNYLYGLNGPASPNYTLLGHFDFTGNTPSGTPPTFTNDFDFTSSANCLPGFTSTWQTNGGNDQFDNDFAYGFSNSGGQGGTGAVYVAVWRRGSGCRVLNINTLTVTGDWGPTGSITGTTCVGTLHNVKIMKVGGATGAVEVNYSTACSDGHGSPYVWQYTGLQFTPQCGNAGGSVDCGGHFTEGLSLWANNSGNGAPHYLDVRAITAPTVPLGIIPNLPTGGYQAGQDMHLGWNALNDTWPFVGTTTLYQSATVANVLTPSTAIKKAWALEVIGFNPAGTQNPIRFANTYNSNANPDFSVGNSVSSVSQDGQYLAFTSDWEDTLGSTTGSAACIPGGFNWVASSTYSANSVLTPVSGHNSGGYSYQTTAGGTSGSSQPATWNQTVGGTQSDGGVTDWKNIGKPTCRGDVFVIPLL